MSFIGVIDSGVGGLTILHKLRQSYQYNYVYLADHAFCPYGQKSNDVLLDRANKLVGYLKMQGAQAVVLACNTISVFANKLQSLNNVPVFDVITPTCQYLADCQNVKRVALLATKATIANGVYQRRLEQCGISVKTFDCSAFVPFIEQDAVISDGCLNAIDAAIRTLPQAQADAVVLGCTHFPLLRSQISQYCNGTRIVECRCILPDGFMPQIKSPSTDYYTTGNEHTADVAAKRFANVKFRRISLI